jgi:hypothetical protein
MRAILYALFFLTSVPAAMAAALQQPTGPVILTVTGAIENTNEGQRAVFDNTMLEKIGLVKLHTSSTWTDGVAEFEGVLASKLLDAVGAKGATVTAIAANDYQIDLSIDELRRYPILFAMKLNGNKLQMRDKGPLWVIYPRDQFPELAGEKHNHKWIWQIKTLIVK